MDIRFLDRLNDLIAAYHPNPNFDVEDLARLLYMSRPTLYRKIGEVSPFTPNELITTARLDSAAGLLVSTDHTIAEIALMAGFHSRSNFGQAFYRRYKATPKAFRLSGRGRIARSCGSASATGGAMPA